MWANLFGGASAAGSGGGGSTAALEMSVAALGSRVDSLEDSPHVACWFEIVGSGSSGTLTPPADGDILLDRFPEGADCLLSNCDALGQPAWESPRTAGGDLVTAELDAAGHWALHGVPADWPVALLYAYRTTLALRDPDHELLDVDLDSGGAGPAGPVAIADVAGLTEVLTAKAPLDHAARHVAGGPDAITPAAIGAAAETDPRLSDARAPLAHVHAQADVSGLGDALAALADRAVTLFALATPIPCVQGVSAEQTLATFLLGAGRVQAGDVLLLAMAWSNTQNGSYSKYAYLRANGTLWQSTAMLNVKAVSTLNHLYVRSLTMQQGYVNPATPFGTSAIDMATATYAADLTGDQIITISGKLHPSATSDAMILEGAWALLLRGAP